MGARVIETEFYRVTFIETESRSCTPFVYTVRVDRSRYNDAYVGVPVSKTSQSTARYRRNRHSGDSVVPLFLPSSCCYPRRRLLRCLCRHKVNACLPSEVELLATVRRAATTMTNDAVRHFVGEARKLAFSGENTADVS
jgi:hypothetical protein